MSTMSMTKRRGAVRLARRIGASPAVPAIAMRAPQTGDEARPMEVASSIGRSSVSVGTPSFAATAGVSGPKAKSGARSSHANTKVHFFTTCAPEPSPYRHFERSREIFFADRWRSMFEARKTQDEGVDEGVVSLQGHVRCQPQCKKDPSATLGMTKGGERMGSQGWRAVFLEEGILVSQPSALAGKVPRRGG